jgi:hypothetical protein
MVVAAVGDALMMVEEETRREQTKGVDSAERSFPHRLGLCDS